MMLIEKKGLEGYTAKIQHPSIGVNWETKTPMKRKELMDKLVELGCHPLDIVDVLDDAGHTGRGYIP